MSAYNHRFKSARPLRCSRDDESPVNHASDAQRHLPNCWRPVNKPSDRPGYTRRCMPRAQLGFRSHRQMPTMALHTSLFRPCCLCVACSIRSAVDLPSVSQNSTHMHSFFCAVSNHQMPLLAPACVWMPRVQKSAFLLSSCTAHSV